MIDTEQRAEIVRQIGAGNMGVISGGRVIVVDNGIELAVGSGYRVRVVLDPTDTYTVSRVYRKGGEEFEHGSISDVYFDEVGELAYRASCFNSYDETQWATPRLTPHG